MYVDARVWPRVHCDYLVQRVRWPLAFLDDAQRPQPRLPSRQCVSNARDFSCWLLLTLFAELQNKQGVDSTVNFSGSITTVRTVLAIAIVGGSLGVGTALIMILDTVAMRNYYILVPTLLFAGSLVVVVSTVIFVLRMK